MKVKKKDSFSRKKTRYANNNKISTPKSQIVFGITSQQHLSEKFHGSKVSYIYIYIYIYYSKKDSRRTYIYIYI